MESLWNITHELTLFRVSVFDTIEEQKDIIVTPNEVFARTVYSGVIAALEYAGTDNLTIRLECGTTTNYMATLEQTNVNTEVSEEMENDA